jgi:hypothetical protein
MLNERQTLNGEFYGLQDPVKANNFEYTKALYEKRLPNLGRANQKKLFKDLERDRQQWHKDVVSGMNGLRKDMNTRLDGIHKEMAEHVHELLATETV